METRITLPLPPSVNTIYSVSRDGRWFKNKRGRDWEEEAGYLLLNCPKFKEQLITLTIYYYFPNIRSDLGNRTKILQDLLEKQGIINNDFQVYEVHEYKNIDKKKPRVEIQIKEFSEK